MPQHAWLIPALPFVSFLLHVFIGRRLGERSSFIGVIAVGASFLLAVASLIRVLAGAEARVSIPWLEVGDKTISMGYRVGPLEAVMLVMVALVGWMVVIYSRGYMHGDLRYNRFFSVVNLFVAAMLTLVIADNLLLFVAGWEIMGMCSYLLIGHWFEDLNNARAAMKAFLTTRLGDVGLLLGIVTLFLATGSFTFEEIWSQAGAGKISGGVATFAALMLFAGAAGKSAQVPLHIWLPDAMAGPTPVSAMIHAATMVAAGVYLVGRAFPIFELAPTAMTVVTVIGAVTALMAALIATVQTDIKKTLAYSTVSQLGLMMLSMGVGGLAAGLFHLLTHAFFKALLFLGSGSVIHAAHTQDMHRMGGLFKKLPVTGMTFIIGTLALSGIPPLAGFFSKDEILLEVFHVNRNFFWVGLAASFLTAYYMWRTVTLTFFGRPRDHHVYEHAHESPWVMTVPLVVLAVPAVLAGFAGAPFLGAPLQHFLLGHAFHEPEPSGFVQAAAIGVGVGGILLGWLIYGLGVINRREAIRALYPLYAILKQKLYFDYVALGLVRLTLILRTLFALFDRHVIDGIIHGLVWLVLYIKNWAGLFDRRVVDDAAHAIAGFFLILGTGASRLAFKGSGQAYALVMFAGILIGTLVLVFWYTI